MNALEERMLTLLAEKMRVRPEIAVDDEVVARQMKTSNPTSEDWIRLAELQSRPSDASARKDPA